MIKRLRLKFIVISLVSVTAVLFIIMSVIFAVNFNSISDRADSILDLLSKNNGNFPREDVFPRRRPDFTPETPYETRFFSVTLSDGGQVLNTDTMSIRAIDSEEVTSYAIRALKKGDRGFVDSYRYKRTAVDNGTLVVFVDCTRDINMFRRFVITGIGVSALGITLVFIAVFFLSKLALAPVEASMKKQKMFITDASHELKTPLTVIDASLEVIEMENGESRWIDNAKTEIIRLRDLCEGLVELTRLDEGSGRMNFEQFDLSSAVISSALPFESPLEAVGRRLSLEVEDGIKAVGDRRALCRLVDLFMDNAVKYSSGEGDVTVSLSKQIGKTVLSVINPCTELPKGEHPEFFERFWRGDESRSKKKEGFGIGLSVAKAIADEHRGKVFADSDGKFVRLRFIF